MVVAQPLQNKELATIIQEKRIKQDKMVNEFETVSYGDKWTRDTNQIYSGRVG